MRFARIRRQKKGRQTRQLGLTIEPAAFSIGPGDDGSKENTTQAVKPEWGKARLAYCWKQ
jgi:hypothetical protein